MSYTITNQCIACDRCLSSCPTSAITREGTHYSIASDLCNNCTGYYSVAQCAAVCPTNQGCIPGATIVFNQPVLISSGDYWERWFDTYNRMVERLRKAKQTAYWEQWFDVYSQRVSTLIQARVGAGSTENTTVTTA